MRHRRTSRPRQKAPGVGAAQQRRTGEEYPMDASQVQSLFRRAVDSDDAAAMWQGLAGMLGAAGHGLSPEREYGVRRPDVVIEMPQSRERIRGRDALRKMQEMF